MDGNNFQNSYIKALEKLRDVLTPAGIQMPEIHHIKLDTVSDGDAMHYMGVPKGGSVSVAVELYFSLESD